MKRLLSIFGLVGLVGSAFAPAAFAGGGMEPSMPYYPGSSQQPSTSATIIRQDSSFKQNSNGSSSSTNTSDLFTVETRGLNVGISAASMVTGPGLVQGTAEYTSLPNNPFGGGSNPIIPFPGELPMGVGGGSIAK